MTSIAAAAQYEGQVVTGYGLRWYFTLMRAAQEGAAQSLWLSPGDCAGGDGTPRADGSP